MNKAYGWIKFENLFEFSHVSTRLYTVHYKKIFFGNYFSRKIALKYLNTIFLSCIYHGDHYTETLYNQIMSDIDTLIEENKNRYICPNSSFFTKYRSCKLEKSKFIELFLANRKIKLGRVQVRRHLYEYYMFYL